MKKLVELGLLHAQKRLDSNSALTASPSTYVSWVGREGGQACCRVTCCRINNSIRLSNVSILLAVDASLPPPPENQPRPSPRSAFASASSVASSSFSVWGTAPALTPRTYRIEQ